MRKSSGGHPPRQFIFTLAGLMANGFPVARNQLLPFGWNADGSRAYLKVRGADIIAARGLLAAQAQSESEAPPD